MTMAQKTQLRGIGNRTHGPQSRTCQSTNPARLRVLCVPLSILIVLLEGPANLRAVDFAAAKSYSVGSTPSGITVGDFNGDGKPDIAVADGQNVSILLGNGDGTFQAAANYSTGNSPSAIAIG